MRGLHPSFPRLPMSRSFRSLALLATMVLTASCGTDPFQPDIENTNFAPALGVDLGASTRDPSGLWYRDLTVGGGATVAADTGISVTVRYTGYLRNGVQFDTGTLPPFVTGAGTVVRGFDLGVRGMRVGGRRQLIIPPSLGYGDSQSGSIPPNSILVFVVDLLSINPRS